MYDHESLKDWVRKNKTLILCVNSWTPKTPSVLPIILCHAHTFQKKKDRLYCLNPRKQLILQLFYNENE